MSNSAGFGVISPGLSSLGLTKARERIAALYRVPENQVLAQVIESLSDHDLQFSTTSAIALPLLQHLRQTQHNDWLSAFLDEYKLSNAEGIALLTLSEALLRVPDITTTNQLLRDKLVNADWQSHRGKTESWLVNSTTAGLSIAQSLLADERGILHRLVARMGESIVRNVAIAATKLLADHFVVGETIDDAIRRAHQEQLLCSFDMLGEAARTRVDAERYFDAYSQAIVSVGNSNHQRVQHAISIKLSALYPRYEPLQRRHAISSIVEKLAQLATLAAQHQLQLTVDAEESERLEMSLDIFERVACLPALRDWDGLGLAVQAYQKRALPVLQWISNLAGELRKPIKVRLVKGAYWDSEIKRCQQLGLSDYPIYTRKNFTDTSYLACARFMLNEELIDCAFATHNALTVSQLRNWMQQRDFNGRKMEFQRLHGMGAELYKKVSENCQVPCRVYAPVGGHRELLAYLVRRMLENGANSSFVQQVRREDMDIKVLLTDPVVSTKKLTLSPNTSIVAPAQLYGVSRCNSAGLDLSDFATLHQIDNAVNHMQPEQLTASVISTVQTNATQSLVIRNPANLSHIVGHVSSTTAIDIARIVAAAQLAHADWASTNVDERAACLERAADRLQEQMLPLMTLLIVEAGKTRLDALNEVREAVDFCRYYAASARDLIKENKLPGPTGESNSLTLVARGVFACISPWNFPLAIFTGQVVAALVTGNCVVAKPAPQTPLIAALVTRLLHQAGIPEAVLHLVPGDAHVGEALIAQSSITGVVFTGSTATARRIAQTLLNNPLRSLVPLIAETGGINAMIVDSTALAEQVVSDVVASAYNSAGQRCSALRLLCLQEDIFDHIVTMLAGVMNELRVGDPADEDTDVGPVIDLDAKGRIDRYLQQHKSHLLHRTAMKELNGYFVVPALLEVDSPQQVAQEVFGPVLHVCRWKAGELSSLLNDINASGYGLTMGVHSRLESTIETVRRLAHVGNLYVNRSMTGAVVGSQPFGGEGLSGTGFKAGGPHYLLRFCTERTVCIDTTAAGGNATLLSNQNE